MTANRIDRRKGAKNPKPSWKIPNAMHFEYLTEIKVASPEVWLNEPAYFLHRESRELKAASARLLPLFCRIRQPRI